MQSTLFPKSEFNVQLWGLALAERFAHPIEEYSILRESYGIHDFSGFEYVRLKGNDAGSLLQGILSHDNHRLKIGESCPSWLLDSNGKITACLFAYRHAETEFILQCQPGTAQNLSKAIDKYIFMEDVVLSIETDLKTYSIQGSKAQHFDMDGLMFQFKHSRCGETGWDLVFPENQQAEIERDLKARDIQPIGVTALDIRRVEELVPWFDVEMEIGKMPLIYGKNRSISYSKGCFLGQETIAMTRDRGRPPALLCQFESPDPQLPQTGVSLMTKGRQAGTLSSIVFSPEFEKPLALGVLQYSLATVGQTLQDQTGQNWLINKVVPWKKG